MGTAVQPFQLHQSGEQRFQTTHWTAVLQAGSADSGMARQAFAALYTQYWRPLYAFVRKRGYTPVEAEDITQDFLVSLLEREALRGLERGRGKFRSFLVKCLSNFLSNTWKRDRAGKRGGKDRLISFDCCEEDARMLAPLASLEDPMSAFERQWVLTLLEAVKVRLEYYYASRNKSALFRAIYPYLLKEEGPGPYGAVAQKLGLGVGAVKVAAHRMRSVYGQLLREEVGRTVESPEEIDEEIRYLIGVLAG
jgi:DNA-directed RNA polymerase specialized sigma24 family protein